MNIQYVTTASELQIAVHNASLAMSKDLSRPILCAICFEYDAELGMVTVTATDSYRLVTTSIREVAGETNWTGAVMIDDSKALLTALKPLPYNTEVTISVTESSEGSTPYLEVKIPGVERSIFHTDIIDGHYPDWHQLTSPPVSTNPETVPPGLNQEYLASIAKLRHPLMEGVMARHAKNFGPVICRTVEPLKPVVWSFARDGLSPRVSMLVMSMRYDEVTV